MLDPASLAGWLAEANLTLLGVTREPKTYALDPADPWRPCMPGQYFSETGDYLAIPTHATAAPDCYSFACDAGFEYRDRACVPAGVSDDVYWIVVSLVSLCVFTVLVASVIITRVVSTAVEARLASLEAPVETHDDTLGMLPVAADEQGNLIFEAEEMEDTEDTMSLSSSESGRE